MEGLNLEIDSNGLTKEQAIKKYRVGSSLIENIILFIDKKGVKTWCFSHNNQPLEDWDRIQKELEKDNKKSYTDYSDWLRDN